MEQVLETEHSDLCKCCDTGISLLMGIREKEKDIFQ